MWTSVDVNKDICVEMPTTIEGIPTSLSLGDKIVNISICFCNKISLEKKNYNCLAYIKDIKNK